TSVDDEPCRAIPPEIDRGRDVRNAQVLGGGGTDYAQALVGTALATEDEVVADELTRGCNRARVRIVVGPLERVVPQAIGPCTEARGQSQRFVFAFGANRERGQL